MTAPEIVQLLTPLGQDSYKRILIKHGIREPVFGVKIEELKKLQKQIKVNYQLSLDLYDTGIYDAMYLAGLIADDMRMTKKDLNLWARQANCPTLSEYTVPWVTAPGPHGPALAREWIKSKSEHIAAAGWGTFSGMMAIKPDDNLDLDELTKLLKGVPGKIHDQPNRVRHLMNSFLIAAGSYVPGLTDLALETAAKVGAVTVDMGGTACKVPDAIAAIKKVAARGAIGKKRKTLKC